MSDERLEAIRGRLEAATDGPWSSVGREIWKGDHREADREMVARACQGLEDVAERSDAHPPEKLTSDADFIAHAPTDLRYLLDRIEAHREVVEAAREVRDQIRFNRTARASIIAQVGSKEAVARLREALDQLEEQTDD